MTYYIPGTSITTDVEFADYDIVLVPTDPDTASALGYDDPADRGHWMLQRDGEWVKNVSPIASDAPLPDADHPDFDEARERVEFEIGEDAHFAEWKRTQERGHADARYVPVFEALDQ